MPTTCVISFENPNRVYYAGQLLSGTVNLTVIDEEKLRGVYVRIYGRAYAQWKQYCGTDHNRDRNRDRNQIGSGGHHVTYTGEKVYLDEKLYLVGDSNTNEVRLSPGTHTYTFQYVLPTGLPTSLEHHVGQITYSANVVLNVPMALDKVFKENFTVIKPVDLNYIPDIRSPAMNGIEETFYPLGFLWCFPNGPLSMEATTPLSGYCPGQTCIVKVNVNNKSKQMLRKMQVQLYKQITFHGTGLHDGRYETIPKHVYFIVAEEALRGCSAGEKVTIDVNLKIPPIPPTDSDYSSANVVQVKYMIRLTGTIKSCCHGIANIDVPITIGSIPLRHNFEPSAVPMPSQNEAVPYSNMPSASTDKCVFANSPSAPPNAPSAPDFSDNPPSYEEAISMGESNIYTFKPKYPMFQQ